METEEDKDLVEDDLSHAEIFYEDIIRVKYSDYSYLIFYPKENFWAIEEDEEYYTLIDDPNNLPKDVDSEKFQKGYKLITEFINRRDNNGTGMP